MNILRKIVRLTCPFPASAEAIIINARRSGLDYDVIGFLNQFQPGEIFRSQADFLTRCEELEFLIREEREMPAENLRSPQD